MYANKPISAELERSLHSLAMHDHACMLYEDSEQLKRQFVPYLCSGLLLGEKCVYFIDENDEQFVMQAMQADGFDVQPYLASGQLEIIHTSKAHLHGGHFSEKNMLAYWHAIIEAAQKAGFKGLRAAVEMTWALSGQPGCEILAPYESRLTNLMCQQDASIICMYSRRKFTPEKIKAVINAHPIVVAQDLILENLACPPSEKCIEGSMELEVQVALGNLELIRELRHSKRELQDKVSQGQAFSLLVTSVKDYAIFMLDPEGKIITWNDGAERIKGYKADEILGKHFSVFYTPEAISRQHPQKELEIAKEKGRYEEEGWRIRKDGSLFWANVVITALYENSKLVGFAKVTRDLTERKTAELARDKAFQELVKVNEELQELALVISHELQEPVSSVKSYTKLLAVRYKGRIGSDADEFLRRIEGGATMTARLVDDLWTYARVTRADSARMEVSTAKLLQEAKDELKELIDASNAQVFNDAYDKFPIVQANKEQLLYVFRELITNAIKHHKGPNIPQLNIAVNQESNGWTFSFRDNGPGIDKFFTQQVFAIYKKLDGKPDESGTGIGLPICKKIIEKQHSGKIAFQSVQGHGASFYFWLPNHPVATE